MKSLCIRALISGEIHELYEMEEDEELTEFSWKIPYCEYPNKIIDGSNTDKYYWLPIPTTIIKI